MSIPPSDLHRLNRSSGEWCYRSRLLFLPNRRTAINGNAYAVRPGEFESALCPGHKLRRDIIAAGLHHACQTVEHGSPADAEDFRRWTRHSKSGTQFRANGDDSPVRNPSGDDQVLNSRVFAVVSDRLAQEACTNQHSFHY